MRLNPVLLAALFALLAAASAPAQPRPRIVNGSNTGEYPEVGALLVYESRGDPAVASLCTGTLIGCRSFLTAAHCVCPFTSDNAAECLRQGLTDPRQLSVLLQNAGRVAVSDVALHPDYEFTEGGDLALLTLAEPVAAIEPARLNDSGRPQLGSDGTIVGFGNTGGPEFEQNDLGIKRMGSVRTSLCPSDINPQTHVCWDFFAVGSNTCGGDSGGPLFLDFGDGARLAGITSGGENPTCLAPDAGFDTDIFVHGDWLYDALATSEGGEPCPQGPVVGSPGVVTTSFDGVLERSDTVRILPIAVPDGTETLPLQQRRLRDPQRVQPEPPPRGRVDARLCRLEPRAVRLLPDR
jgi:secreted trypsin-like serine protease